MKKETEKISLYDKDGKSRLSKTFIAEYINEVLKLKKEKKLTEEDIEDYTMILGKKEEENGITEIVYKIINGEKINNKYSYILVAHKGDPDYEMAEWLLKRSEEIKEATGIKDIKEIMTMVACTEEEIEILKRNVKKAPTPNVLVRIKEDGKIIEEYYSEIPLVTKMMKLMNIEEVSELIKEYNEMVEKSDNDKEVGILKAVVTTCLEYELGEEKAKEEIKKLIK